MDWSAEVWSTARRHNGRESIDVDPSYIAALELATGRTASPNEIARVGRATTPEAARWAFGQWELRRRARDKFARAEQMLFVREALEQATHERVAAYHASLFPPDVMVADLTAGIGADLIALAARGPAIGFELDPERAALARHNLEVHGLSGEVRVEDSLAWLALESAGLEYAFADPARRVEGRRTLDPADFAPDPVQLSAYLEGMRLGAMKLTPMLSDAFLESLGPSLRFVSFGGECREVLILNGTDARSERVAVHVESGAILTAGPIAPVTEEPAAFFFDADPAAVRAHALGALAGELRSLGDSNGYLTGDEGVVSPWLRTYRVLYHGKADAKATKRALRELGAGTPELKQRGAGLDLVKERKGYAGEGTRAVSLAIWSVGRSLRHTILERV